MNRYYIKLNIDVGKVVRLDPKTTIVLTHSFFQDLVRDINSTNNMAYFCPVFMKTKDTDSKRVGIVLPNHALLRGKHIYTTIYIEKEAEKYVSKAINRATFEPSIDYKLHFEDGIYEKSNGMFFLKKLHFLNAKFMNIIINPYDWGNKLPNTYEAIDKSIEEIKKEIACN